MFAAVKAFFTSPKRLSIALLVILLGAGGIFGAYWLGQRNGKTDERYAQARKQSEVSQEQLKSQQRDRQMLSDKSESLATQRYQYETIIQTEPKLQDWAAQLLPDCASELSAGPGMSISSCSMLTGPDLGEGAEDRASGSN